MAEVTVRSAIWTMLAGVVLASAPVIAQQRPAAPAAAAAPTVRAGVDLWRAGDWAGAVAIWQPFALEGDADAMFNMGQAYKLGRAVTLDKVVARDWYRKAALKNHLPAAANLGILLFQAGEKPEAARWLKTAADRGEMRAQYVLGVAHWNGDGVAKSLPLAYAYLNRASAQGLTEATAALGNLNRTISAADRANGETVAASLAAGSGVPGALAARPGPMSTAELNRMNMEAVQRPAPVAVPTTRSPVVDKPDEPSSVAVAAAPKPVAVAPPVERPPAPAVENVEIPASAPVAVAVAKPVEPPKPAAKPVDKPVEKPVVQAKATPKPAPTPPGWRVQLGAFGSRSQAETAWTEFKTKQKAAVGTAKPIYEPGTSITKLQMGPYKTRAEAKDACAKIAFGGRACFVTEAAAGK